MSDENTDIAEGKEGCRCVDASDALSTLSERSCKTADGRNGVVLAAGGPCVPDSYGSNTCLQHDFINDPKCSLGLASFLGNDYPTYCIRPWCYVDAKECMQTSERVYRSHFFPFEGLDLFYSYTTCGSSDDDWTYYQQHHVLGSRNIEAAVGSYLNPYMYKRGPDGDVLTVRGDEYYDSSVPYGGVLIELLDSLQRTSKGDFNMTYTFGSASSRLLHPTSSFTAVVQDVKDGLVDMGVGPFWVTGERLKMTSFTVPIASDKTVLVIRKPGTKTSLSAQSAKIWAPFSPWVWILILATITLTALLSVWFSDKTLMAAKRLGRSSRQVKRPQRPKKIVYARLALDEFLSKGMFFCSAGVEQNEGASLPHKLLMFGFSFFILIVVSAYVANLAAFLTNNVSEYTGTVQGVIDKGLVICAHPALKTELEMAHEKAKFVFSQSESEFYGVLDDFDAGKCDVMAIGEIDTRNDIELMNMYCERKLVFTESVFIENAVAFPIKPELGAGLSYWLHEGSKSKGITLESVQEKYDTKHKRETKCEVEFSSEDFESSDLAQIQVENLFFPLVFFGTFAVAAAGLQIFYQWAVKKGRRQSSLIGRASELDAYRVKDSFKITDCSTRKNVSFQGCEDNVFQYDEDDGVDDDGKDVETQSSPKETVSAVSPLAKGTVLSENTIELDNFRENSVEQAVRKRAHSLNSEERAASKLQIMVETGALDELLSFAKTIKEENQS